MCVHEEHTRAEIDCAHSIIFNTFPPTVPLIFASLLSRPGMQKFPHPIFQTRLVRLVSQKRLLNCKVSAFMKYSVLLPFIVVIFPSVKHHRKGPSHPGECNFCIVWCFFNYQYNHARIDRFQSKKTKQKTKRFFLTLIRNL